MEPGKRLLTWHISGGFLLKELLCMLCGVVWKLRWESQKWFRAALSSVLRFLRPWDRFVVGKFPKSEVRKEPEKRLLTWHISGGFLLNELLCMELCGVVWKLRRESQKWFRAALSGVLRFLRLWDRFVVGKFPKSVRKVATKNFNFSKRL